MPATPDNFASGSGPNGDGSSGGGTNGNGANGNGASSEQRPQPEPLILNVNDSEGARYLVTLMLRKAGFVVTEAATGLEALEAIQRRKPDLIVLDLQLPDLNGLEVCRRSARTRRWPRSRSCTRRPRTSPSTTRSRASTAAPTATWRSPSSRRI